MDRQSRFADGRGHAVRQANGSAIRPANFGAPLPSVGGAKGSKPTIWTETRRDVPRGNAPARVKHVWRARDANVLAKRTRRGILAKRTRGLRCDARLLRFARNDVDGVIETQTRSLRGARSATKQSPLRGWCLMATQGDGVLA